jgi:hypothetical protein
MKARSGRIRTRIRPLAAQPVAPEYLGRREPRKRRLTAVFGAPRSMKMGTTASLWRYDAAAAHATRSANFGRPAKLHSVGQAAFGLFTVSIRSRILPRSRFAT